MRTLLAMIWRGCMQCQSKKKGLKYSPGSSLDPRRLWETFVSSSPIQMPKIRSIQTSPKRSKKKMRVVQRFRVQTQLMVQWQGVGVFGDHRQRHHQPRWRLCWQWSEGGVGRAYAHAPTQQWNQLAFTRHASNKRRPFYICYKQLKQL